MKRVGDAAELAAAGRKLVKVGDREVVVFAVDGQWLAYENRCPHAGGPVCQGRIMPKVEVEILDRGKISEERFSKDEFRIVCPWHGWEFDLESGVAPDGRRRLRRFPVEEREDGVYVGV